MARKTITLELDAYERLRAAKRPSESFSDAVRRAIAIFPDLPPTGADLAAYFSGGGSGVSDAYLDAVERAANDARPPRATLGADPRYEFSRVPGLSAMGF
jgi:hypothetical protein